MSRSIGKEWLDKHPTSILLVHLPFLVSFWWFSQQQLVFPPSFCALISKERLMFNWTIHDRLSKDMGLGNFDLWLVYP